MKALVVRFSAIGDCVMAVPVAESIRRAHTEARIVWAIEPRCSAVVDVGRLVNEFKFFPRDDWEQSRWSPGTWWDQIRTYTSMRRHRFDIGIDVQGHSKTALCLRLASPRRRIAVRANDALARRLNPVIEVTRMDRHTVEHNLMTLARLGDYPQDPRWIMPELSEEKAKLRQVLPQGKPLATITVSAGQRPKAYPADQWREVAQGLLANGFNVVFLGGPGDVRIPVEDTTDLVDALPLKMTMAAVAGSDLHLAADTGTGHMAAAYNVPVVSIFGHTKVSAYRPYTENGIVLEGEAGTESVEPELVIEAALKLHHAQVSR